MPESLKQTTIASRATQRFATLPFRSAGWIVAGALIAVLILAWPEWLLFGPYLLQAAHLREQNRISHQVLPSGTVIYIEGPGRIAILRGRTDYRSRREYWGTQSAAGVPDAWERAYGNDSLSALQGAVVGNCPINDTFGYRRTSSNGVEWIVHLDQVNPRAVAAGCRKVGLTQGAFRPVGCRPGSRGVCVSVMSKQLLMRQSDIFTLFAPQPDPADASRVNVAYELNGQGGELKAVVMDRGYVDFSTASGLARVMAWNRS
jgi:hypothetical protein